MHRLLIATTNLAKFEEAQALLRDEAITILGLADFSAIEVVDEAGATFEENAILKAKGYHAQAGVPCIADDGGLVVVYLNGAPGVSSHRWLGHSATDEELANAVIEKLKGVPQNQRTARLGGYIAFVGTVIPY